MIIVLKKTIEDHGYLNGQYQKLMSIPAGTPVQAFNFYNIPDHIKENWTNNVLDKLEKGQSFAFYVKTGVWLVVPREDVEIPKVWNGYLNV